MNQVNRSHRAFKKKVHKDPQPFLVYYTLILKFKSSQDLKSVIMARSSKEAKEILFNKIKRDYLAFEIKGIKPFLIRKNNYRGKRLSDKEWDTLLKVSYPNSKHKLYKFNKDARAKKIVSPHRDEFGRWSKGHTPWNKNLKLQIISQTKDGKFKSARDIKGKFTDGNKPIIVGAKPAKDVG